MTPPNWLALGVVFDDGQFLNPKPMRINYVGYEWTIETIDDDDIVDVDFSDTLNFAPEPNQRVGLRRYKGNSIDGIIEGEYVYPINGKLPIQFEDGLEIPARYHAEYQKWLSR